MRLSDQAKTRIVDYMKEHRIAFENNTAVDIAVSLNNVRIPGGFYMDPITPRVATTLANLAGISLSRKVAKPAVTPEPEQREIVEFNDTRDRHAEFARLAGNCPYNIGRAIECLWEAVRHGRSTESLQFAVNCLQREIKRREESR